jgi:ribonuclease Z
MTVQEVGLQAIESVRLAAHTGFRAEPLDSRPFDGILSDMPQYQVATAHLDHRIPCLGFALTEKTRLNVRPERLAEMGVPAGRWLNHLKQAIREGLPDDTLIRAEWTEGSASHARELPLGELRERLIVETRGQRIAYVVDTIYSRENIQRITELVHGADIFFCESLFVDTDRDQASKRFHLTARQAGSLARAAQVRRLETFHFSPRYDRDPEPIRAEAQAAFRGAIPPDDPD